MSSFEEELHRRLAAIRAANLHRELQRIDSPQSVLLRLGNRRVRNFSSNDYLGLANEPAVKNAAIEAVKRFGAGSGASRLVCGSLAPHHQLEETLAAFKNTEAALAFASGYATSLGAICALLDRDSVVILDKLVHASIVDAARLSGATIRVFPHNDLDALEKILKSSRRRTVQSAPRSAARPLIVTESIFSMDGDRAPLRELVALKEKYGAWLMVDEAHATGLYGKHRRGLAEQEGVADRIEIQMGTLGKALGASGGYICGSRALIDYLINRARSFIFTTAPAPAAAAAATAAIRFVQSRFGEARRQTLWDRIDTFHSKVKLPTKFRSAIIPILIGSEPKAVGVAARLRRENFFVPAIRYPTVARNTARLRITLTAMHSAADIAALAKTLRDTVKPDRNSKIENRKSR
jgi:8-amino-7-oxononanoate synthase